MTLTLYKTLSDSITLDKELEQIIILSGILREESSIIDPVILIEDIDDFLPEMNYAYIQEFNRYYYITGIESVRQGLWRVSFHVDVLYTYKDAIRENSGIIERNENLYDLQLNDGLFRTRQNPRIVQVPFPSGFNTWNFVLGVAGN